MLIVIAKMVAGEQAQPFRVMVGSGLEETFSFKRAIWSVRKVGAEIKELY